MCCNNATKNKKEQCMKKPSKKMETPESAQAGETPASPGESPGPSNAMVALFQSLRPMSALSGLKRKNLPQLVKAVDQGKENIPVGATVIGIIVDVVRSPVTTIKGSLLWLALLKPSEDGRTLENIGMEICFPATGAIRQALCPGLKKDDENKEEKARKEMLAFKGFLFCAQRMPNKISKDYQKEMTTWDIRISDSSEAGKYGVQVN